jgi:hypothetical protein
VSVLLASPLLAAEKIHPIHAPTTSVGRYHSPDHKFFIDLRNDKKSVHRRFAVYSYELIKGERKAVRRTLGQGITDLQQIVWVPKRPHTLLFSTTGSSDGPPFVAMWDGRKVSVILRGRAGTPRIVATSLLITGISADGRVLVYRYLEPGVPFSEEKFRKLHRVLVPETKT